MIKHSEMLRRAAQVMRSGSVNFLCFAVDTAAIDWINDFWFGKVDTTEPVSKVYVVRDEIIEHIQNMICPYDDVINWLGDTHGIFPEYSHEEREYRARWAEHLAQEYEAGGK